MVNRLRRRPELPDPADSRRLPALRPEQGEGVGRLCGRRRLATSAQQRRLPGRRLQRRAAGSSAPGDDRLNGFIDHYAHRPAPGRSRSPPSTSPPRFRSARRTPAAGPADERGHVHRADLRAARPEHAHRRACRARRRRLERRANPTPRTPTRSPTRRQRRPLSGRDRAAGPGVASYTSDPLADACDDDRRRQR